jgi:hypothetical protein
VEKRMMNLVDQRVNALRNDLARESKTRYEAIEHLENCLEVPYSASLMLVFFRETFLSCRRKSEMRQMKGKSWTMLSSRRRMKKAKEWWNSFKEKRSRERKLKNQYWSY